MCDADDLALRIDAWTASYDSRILSVALRNTGPQPCRIASRYGAAVLDEVGRRLVASPTPGGSTRTRLLAGGAAHAGIVDWSSWCRPRATPVALALLPDGDDGEVSTDLPPTLKLPRCAAGVTPAIAPFFVLEEYVADRGFYPVLDDVSLSDDQRALTLDFEGEAPCPDDYEASVLVAGEELYVGLFDARYRRRGRPDGGGRCTHEDPKRELDVALAAPFRGSTVLIRGGKERHLVRPPEPLLQLTALPEDWELRSQGDVRGQPAWERVYSPLARPAGKGRNRLTFIQTSFFPAAPEQPGARAVTVNRTAARLYRDPSTRELVLEWVLGSGRLTVSAHEADFSEEELIALAESAEPDPSGGSNRGPQSPGAPPFQLTPLPGTGTPYDADDIAKMLDAVEISGAPDRWPRWAAAGLARQVFTFDGQRYLTPTFDSSSCDRARCVVVVHGTNLRAPEYRHLSDYQTFHVDLARRTVKRLDSDPSGYSAMPDEYREELTSRISSLLPPDIGGAPPAWWSPPPRYGIFRSSYTVDLNGSCIEVNVVYDWDRHELVSISRVTITPPPAEC